jgi:hypothetical protein
MSTTGTVFETQVLEGLTSLSKQQAENAKQQAKFEAVVLARLDRIEQNTITLLGSVISDFQGISESTKNELEACSAELANLEPELVHAYATDKDARKEINAKELGLAEKQPGKNGRKGFVKPVIKVGQIAASFNPALTNGEKRAIGNWIGNILHKVFPATKFSGKYHPQLENLVSVLVGYYTVERDVTSSIRKY